MRRQRRLPPAPASAQRRCLCPAASCGNGMKEFGEQLRRRATPRPVPVRVRRIAPAARSAATTIVEGGEECDGSGSVGLSRGGLPGRLHLRAVLRRRHDRCRRGMRRHRHRRLPGHVPGRLPVLAVLRRRRAPGAASSATAPTTRSARANARGSAPVRAQASSPSPSSRAPTSTPAGPARRTTRRCRPARRISGELSGCDGSSDFELRLLRQRRLVLLGRSDAGLPQQQPTAAAPAPASSTPSARRCRCRPAASRRASSIASRPTRPGTYNLQTGCDGAQRPPELAGAPRHRGERALSDLRLRHAESARLPDRARRGTCTGIIGSPACTVGGTGPLGPTSNDCSAELVVERLGRRSRHPVHARHHRHVTLRRPINRATAPGFTRTRAAGATASRSRTNVQRACDGGSNNNQPCTSDAECPGAPAGCVQAALPADRRRGGRGRRVRRRSAHADLQRCARGRLSDQQQLPGRHGALRRQEPALLPRSDREDRDARHHHQQSVSTFCIPGDQRRRPSIRRPACPGPGAIALPEHVDGGASAATTTSTASSRNATAPTTTTVPAACLANCKLQHAPAATTSSSSASNATARNAPACPGQCGAPGTPAECPVRRSAATASSAPASNAIRAASAARRRRPMRHARPVHVPELPMHGRPCLNRNGASTPASLASFRLSAAGPRQACLLCQQCFPPPRRDPPEPRVHLRQLEHRADRGLRAAGASAAAPASSASLAPATRASRCSGPVLRQPQHRAGRDLRAPGDRLRTGRALRPLRPVHPVLPDLRQPQHRGRRGLRAARARLRAAAGLLGVHPVRAVMR